MKLITTNTLHVQKKVTDLNDFSQEVNISISTGDKFLNTFRNIEINGQYIKQFGSETFGKSRR
jgi:hypothetical protein